ncbi:MAG: hypothetical protein QME12_09060, partial [Nanoarchaeota archaeon]|nr:hypothetical protein [Nanoarchaeota archaeon]
GHYVIHPRELSDLLYHGHLAKAWFKQKWKPIYAYYTDVCDNLPQMLVTSPPEKAGSIKELYKAMHRLSERGNFVSRRVGQKLTPEDIKALTAVSRLLTAFYQKQTCEDFGVKLEPELEERMQKLMAIDFTNRKDEAAKLQYFGEVIKDLIASPPKSKGRKGKGSSGGNDGFSDDDDSEAGNGPILGDISPDDFSDDQIEEALDKIIRKYGRARYDKIREFAEEELGKQFDKRTNKNSGKMAGIGSVSQIERNDDSIPYYDRLSRSSGIYIVKKPVIVNAKDNYPAENVEFSPSDPLHRLNKFSTGGRIMPGITKRFREGIGRRRDRTYRVPDCFLCLDTSGSMPHPDSKSPAVHCGFTLAKNYHANGAKVGVLNFSADSFMLFPTRELDEVFRALCAYWGGGTVLDTNKLHEYIQHYRLFEIGKLKPKDLEISTEEDYKRLIERLSPSERKQFEKKAGINVRLNETKEAYGKLDTHIITDGEIFNMPEVIGYFNSLAGTARNAVYVVGNPVQYNRWESLELPNTQVLNVEKPEDLHGFVIGRIKKINPEPVRKNLFGRG